MQNRLKLINIFLFLLFCSVYAYAYEPKAKSSISLIGMNMDYREYDDNDLIKNSEKSAFRELIGFEVGYDFYFSRDANSYSEFDTNFMFISGETEYIGSLLYSNDPYGSYRGKTNNKIADIDMSYRYNYIANSTISFNYGLGLGFRYWLRSLSLSQEEFYYWFSLRPSFGLNMQLFSNLYVAPRVTYQYGILPQMHASDLSHTFTLGSANIVSITVPLNYELNRKIDLFVSYTYEEQTIEKSDVFQKGSYNYYEPDSTAKNQYLKFGVAFKY